MRAIRVEIDQSCVERAWMEYDVLALYNLLFFLRKYTIQEIHDSVKLA